MSLFQCSKCGVKENTALSDGGYLARLINAESLYEKGLDVSGRYCSECYAGKWHGKFPKEFFPRGSMITDHEGNLRSRRKLQDLSPDLVSRGTPESESK